MPSSFLVGETNTQEQSRLLNVVVLVAQDTNTAWLHHKTQWKRQIVAQPALREGSSGMAVGNKNDVFRLIVVHVRCLKLTDVLDQFIEAC